MSASNFGFGKLSFCTVKVCNFSENTVRRLGFNQFRFSKCSFSKCMTSEFLLNIIRRGALRLTNLILLDFLFGKCSVS